jgi:ABC-type sugar transport system ATPase subunit
MLDVVEAPESRSGGPLLTARGIVKSFGATRALRGANLALRAGEVHALMGENGAGKSTLVKILVGAVQPDAGELRLAGRPLRLAGVVAAIAERIVPVYQQLTLMPHLSVRENLFAFEIAAGRGFATLPSAASPEDAREVLSEVGLDLDPETPVARLSLGERQLLEIARGLTRAARVLILDEPTAALNAGEAQRLFAVMRAIVAKGAAVLYISHRIDEIEEIADRVTVLRDGRTVIDGAPGAELERQAIVSAMIGRSVATTRRARPHAGDPLLRADGLQVPGVVDGATMTLHRGEILGIVGLIGSGAIELGAAIAGAVPAGGRLTLAERPVRLGDATAARRAGIGLIPGDREEEGVFPILSVLANASAAILHDIGRWWLSPQRERHRLGGLLRQVTVTPDDPDLPINQLSGGNQQKVVVARNLAIARLAVLVALEPTRGVDIGAREAVHDALVAAARAGTGVIIVSSDLEEIFAIAHRILVMRRGRIVAELPADAEPGRVMAELAGATA